MKTKLLIIRITIIWGILADTIETVRMSFPDIFITSGQFNIKPDAAFSFGLINAAPLMLGWTLVLVWTLLKPVERIGVVLCLIPVVMYSIVVNVIGLNTGVAQLKSIIPVLILQSILLVLCILSYIFGIQLIKEKK